MLIQLENKLTLLGYWSFFHTFSTRFKNCSYNEFWYLGSMYEAAVERREGINKTVQTDVQQIFKVNTSVRIWQYMDMNIPQKKSWGK